jgi:hypothetical protein
VHPEPDSTKILQIGNKQILTIEHQITIDSYIQNSNELKKQINNDEPNKFWCQCQGWLDTAEKTILSERVEIKLAFIDDFFEWEPIATFGLIGKSVEIRCLPPDGSPRPTVRWLKNDSPLDPSDRRLIISNEGSLLINQVQLIDSANYTCVAENLAGKRTSDSAELIVRQNLGWSEWSEWDICKIATTTTNDCGEGTQTRHRTCLNPPTINNAIGCNGFPTQSISCYIPCLLPNSNKNEPTLIHETDSIDFEPAEYFNDISMNEKQQQQQQQQQEKPELSLRNSDTKGINLNEIDNNKDNSIKRISWWSEWGSWSMVCNSDCKRTRKRECLTGYYDQNNMLVIDPPEERTNEQTIIKKSSKCSGSSFEFDDCTFYCEKVSNSK